VLVADLARWCNNQRISGSTLLCRIATLNSSCSHSRASVTNGYNYLDRTNRGLCFYIFSVFFSICLQDCSQWTDIWRNFWMLVQFGDDQMTVGGSFLGVGGTVLTFQIWLHVLSTSVDWKVWRKSNVGSLLPCWWLSHLWTNKADCIQSSRN